MNLLSHVANPADETADLRFKWIATLFYPALIALASLPRGFRLEHAVLGGTMLLAVWSGARGRVFARLAFPLVLTGVLYELFHSLLALRGPIHVAALYRAELALFGIRDAAGTLRVPAHLFDAHPVAALDVLCGAAYILYLYETVAAALWLFFRDRARMSHLSWAFFLVNLIGMAIWLLYPAAPPWYVAEHGLGPANLHALPSAAGAARFDALLGVSYFDAFYRRNVNVFGAMPSLHAAYPLLVVFATWPLGWRVRAAAVMFALLVAFSAVYLNHHYVLDVLAGAACATFAWALASVSLRPRARFFKETRHG